MLRTLPCRERPPWRSGHTRNATEGVPYSPLLDFNKAFLTLFLDPAGDPALAGSYRDGEHKVEVVVRGTDLYLIDSGSAHRLEPFGAASYLAGGGRFKGWPVDFSVKDTLRAGPFELSRREVPAPADPSPLDRFSGTYRADDFGEVVVFRRGKELIFAFNRAEQVRLEPIGEDSFRIVGGSCDGEPAEFRVEKGRVTGLRAGYMDFQRGAF